MVRFFLSKHDVSGDPNRSQQRRVNCGMCLRAGFRVVNMLVLRVRNAFYDNKHQLLGRNNRNSQQSIVLSLSSFGRVDRSRLHKISPVIFSRNASSFQEMKPGIFGILQTYRAFLVQTQTIPGRSQVPFVVLKFQNTCHFVNVLFWWDSPPPVGATFREYQKEAKEKDYN